MTLIFFFGGGGGEEVRWKTVRTYGKILATPLSTVQEPLTYSSILNLELEGVIVIDIGKIWQRTFIFILSSQGP